jgi:hypothetical protein
MKLGVMGWAALSMGAVLVLWLLHAAELLVLHTVLWIATQ